MSSEDAVPPVKSLAPRKFTDTYSNKPPWWFALSVWFFPVWWLMGYVFSLPAITRIATQFGFDLPSLLSQQGLCAPFIVIPVLWGALLLKTNNWFRRRLPIMIIVWIALIVLGDVTQGAMSMNRFRLASRELFNQYFAVPHPPADYSCEYYDGFNAVEKVLFQMLVLEPCSIPPVEGEYSFGLRAHHGIRVRLPNPNVGEGLVGQQSLVAPIMLNREVNSGYWDDPLSRFTNDAILLFICFFDWDSMNSRDNAFVRVQVGDWPGHPEVVGKHGLVESSLVRYALTEPTAV